MKAIRFHEFGPPAALRYDDVEVPAPAPGEALVRVHAVGVNRMDVEMRAGIYGGESLMDFYFGQMMEFPHTPGIEPAGVVEAVGEGVTAVKPGDRVVPHSHLSCGACRQCLAGHDNACAQIRVLGVQTPGIGGYAEYFTWPARLLIPLPDSVTYEQGAALLVNYGPVWTALIQRAELRPGDTLLITGATGGCGHAAIEIGRLTGARVLALGGGDEKLEELASMGAEPIDYRGGFAADVLEATDGRGADVVLELVGADTFKESLGAAAGRGRVAVIGSHGGIQTELNLGLLFAMNLQIHGITRGNQASMQKLVELAGTGVLTPKIFRTLALAEAAEAHRLMDERKHSGKIVLSVA
ncbi:MAG: zinc-binding dehydrogenase [Solirubrobacterales bacterium]|jgi:NADPH:quinone reductase-like Zn-dependent oxidoreductase|nr:zinc-binding dehydrogenase [Solirubrobacterales bacterium]